MDLLVSVTNPAAGEVAKACLRDYSQGSVDVRVFDNCDRDLGPLLSGFGKTILERYDIIGHMHTKKSVGIYSGEAFVQHWVQFLYANLFRMSTRWRIICHIQQIFIKLALEQSCFHRFQDMGNALFHR